MIDTHAHLNFPRLLASVEETIEKSKQVGLVGIIVVSSSLEDSRKSVELVRQYSGFLWSCVGIHPQKTDPETKASIKNQLKELDTLIENNKNIVVAVGECGLDFSSVPAGEEERSIEDQKELFLGQIELAQKHNLPLVVHARKATDEVIEIIRSVNDKDLCGVFHCYSGGRKRVVKVLELAGEWYFGVDGNITYELGLQNVIAKIPHNRLLLETDAPSLAPEPHRGELCTPTFLPLIAKSVAEVWGVGVEEVDKQTTENAIRLFVL